ncbi:MAG: PGF-pre-PGF domain-containing protein [Methanosarcina sp.]
MSTSPEPSKNVEVKETAQAFITNGKNVKFEFANKKTCVLYISFDAKKTLGKTKATVEMLKGKSDLVSQLPEDQTYKCFNVWIGNNGVITPQNIENATIYFKVQKDWLENNKIDKDSISLNRYNSGKWEKLQTIISEEDEKYIYLNAKTQGFSQFAITAETITQENKDKSDKENRNKDQRQEQNKNKSDPVTKPENENKINIEPITKDLEQNNADTKENTEKQKENTKIPGFNAVFAGAAILTIVLYQKLHKK